MNGLGLCAGVGGLELGIGLAVPGYRGVGYVERESFAQAVLVARMEEEALAPAPIWDDLETFDGRPFRGVVDLVSAGFPCQPFSVAGRGDGLEDERWVWPELERILREVRPRWVFLENVPGLVRHGLWAVVRDLAALGYDAEWDLFSAGAIGAPHRRERFFLLARRISDTGGDRVRDESERGPGAALEADGGHAESRNVGELVADTGRPERGTRPSARHEGGGADGDERGAEGSGRSRGGGADLADADGSGREGVGVGRASIGVRRGRGDTARPTRPGGGDRVADAGREDRRSRSRSERAGRSESSGSDGDVAGAVAESSSGGRGVGGESPERGGQPELGHPDGAHGPGLETRGSSGGDLADPDARRRGEHDRVPNPRGWIEPEPAWHGPLFPPGPSDVDSWGWVVAHRPELSPALPAAPARPKRAPDEEVAPPKSILRRVANGVAYLLDARTDRLRACGNGVVPVAAAFALLALADRAGWLADLLGEPDR